MWCFETWFSQGMVVLGSWLVSMILEFVSNLNDSMLLWFLFVLFKGPLPTSTHSNSWLCSELAAREGDDGVGNGRRFKEKRGEEAELLISLIKKQGANLSYLGFPFSLVTSMCSLQPPAHAFSVSVYPLLHTLKGKVLQQQWEWLDPKKSVFRRYLLDSSLHNQTGEHISPFFTDN